MTTTKQDPLIPKAAKKADSEETDPRLTLQQVSQSFKNILKLNLKYDCLKYTFLTTGPRGAPEDPGDAVEDASEAALGDGG